MMDRTRSPLPWLTGYAVLIFTLLVVMVGDLTAAGSQGTLGRSITVPASAITSIVMWLIAFVLLGAGSLLVLRKAGTAADALVPLGLYALLLAALTYWNLMLSGFGEPLIALGCLVASWLLYVALMQAFARWSRLAAWIQLPGLAWTSIAISLNAVSWLAG